MSADHHFEVSQCRNQLKTLGRPHLTCEELAERWNCTARTVRRNHQQWGLRPITITGQHLFPLSQIESLEAAAVEGKVAFPVRGGGRRVIAAE